MNRDIKFRAWDEVSEKMLNWNEFLDTNMKNTFIAPESTGLILMQYTGFHDRFGNEIYENDIVYVHSEDENATIEWDEQTARFIIHFDGWIADFDNYYGKELEIMGDIYNNPELLGGEDEC